MIKITGMEHVGIATNSIPEALSFYSLLGLKVAKSETIPERGIKLAFIPSGEGQGDVELLEPTNPESSIAKFLASRGEGIHHVCFRVEDIDGAVKELTAAGVRMIDPKPRPGAGGYRIAFIHPDSTHGVLVELLGD